MQQHLLESLLVLHPIGGLQAKLSKAGKLPTEWAGKTEIPDQMKFLKARYFGFTNEQNNSFLL